MKKILILASNSRKDLNLDREIRDLKAAVERSRYREQLEVVDELAVRVEDLQGLLLKHRPQIIHFCGHGGGEQGLVFDSEDGRERWVRTEALSELFRLCSNLFTVECVLLNACYSEEQASAIVAHINYVIGISQEIQDQAAIAFSTGFYQALGYACSIEQSYGFGCNAIQLKISESSVVRSTNEAQRQLEVVNAIAKTVIPEHLKPILKKHRDLTLNQNVASRASQPLSQAVQIAIQQDVVQLLQEEPASFSQDRQQIRPLSVDTVDLRSERGIDYTRLRHLLQAGNWSDADDETRMALLKLADRQQGINEADIKKLPCTDLQTIDCLWTKYSNGRFGFSTQKKIFLEVGGILDGKHDQEIWLRLAGSAGWLKDQGLIDYADANFGESAPDGHLPFKVYRLDCLLVGACIWWLTRFDACRL